MGTHYTQVIPGSPRYLLSANRRPHWSIRYEVQQYWRGLGRLMFKRAPRYQRARVTVTFRFPNKRRRDVANLYPYVVKPLIDGMVDAGVLPDDDDKHLVGPDMRREERVGPLRITVTIEPTGE